MKFFDEYVNCYDMNDPDINYKYYHSYRVMEAMELLGTKLNLPKKDIELAKVIGLVHDIGRFEQDKLYNSFKDGKFDHGSYGVKVLKENKFLKTINIDEEDFEVVYKAVENHNKLEIKKDLTEREILFSKMIRDADKIDILYVLGNENFDRIRQDNGSISKNIENNFFKKQLIDIKNMGTTNDQLVLAFSYIYDINFKETFKIIRHYKYYDKLYERINRKDIFKKYLDYANKYIEERIENNVR